MDIGDGAHLMRSLTDDESAKAMRATRGVS
jgi:hypothetical protein